MYSSGIHFILYKSVTRQLTHYQNKKILGLSKSKAFADNKIKVTESLKSVLWRVENIVGKRENAGYQRK